MLDSAVPAAQPAKPKRKRSVPVRIARGLGWTLLALMLLVGTVLLGANVYLTDARLTGLVRKLLHENLAGRFEIGAVRWRLPFRVRVDDVVIATPTGDPVARVAHVAANLRALALFRKTIRIAPATVEGLEVHLVPPPAGSTSTAAFTLLEALAPRHPSPTPEPKSKEPPSLRIEVDDANLSRLGAEVELPSLGVRVVNLDLRSAAFALRGAKMEVKGQLRVEAINLAQRERDGDVHPAGAATREVEGAPPIPGPIRIGPIALTVEDTVYDRDLEQETSAVRVGRAEITVGRTRLAIAGKIEDLGGHPHGTLTAKARLDADDPDLRAPLGALLGRELPLHGEAELLAELRGSAAHGATSLALTGDHLALGRAALSRLAAEVGIDGEHVHLARLELDADRGRIEAHGDAALTRHGIEHAIALRIERFPAARALADLAPPGVLPESVSATISAKGPALNPPRSAVKASIHLAGLPPHATGGAFREVRAALDARLEATRAAIQALDVTAERFQLHAAGEAPLSARGPMDLTVHAVGRDLGPVLARLRAPVDVEVLELALHGAGTFSRPEVQGTVSAQGVRSGQVPPLNAVLPLRFAAGRLEIARGRLAVAQGVVHLDGEARLLDAAGMALARPRFRARITAGSFPMASLTGGQVTGAVTATIAVAGTPQAFTAQASVVAPRLNVRSATVSLPRLTIQGDAQELRLTGLVLAPARGGRLRATGAARLADRTFEAHLEGRRLPLALASDLSEGAADLEGTIDLDVQASGPFAQPKLQASLRGNDLRVNGEEVGPLAIDARGDLDDLEAKVRVDQPRGHLGVDGHLSIRKKSADVHLTAARLQISRLLELAGSDAALEGNVAASITAKGPLARPALRGSVAINDLALDGDPIPRGYAEIIVGSDPLSGAYQLDALAMDKIRLRAHLAPRVGSKGAGGPPVVGEARLELADIALEDVVPGLRQRGLKTHIAGAANVHIGEGKQAITGDLSLTTLSVQSGSRTLEAVEPIRLDLAGQEVNVRSFKLVGPEGRFDLTGHAGKADLALAAHGALDLGLIEPLVPQLTSASGVVVLQLEVSGTPDAPDAHGSVRLATPLDVRMRGSVRTIHLDRAELALSPTQVKIDALSGSIGSGSFSAGGTIGLRGFRPASYDVDVVAEDISIQTSQVMVDVNARVNAYGTGLVPSLRGDVQIVHGRYLQQFTLQNFNFVAKSSDEDLGGGPSERPAWMSDMELDLHAISTGTINVKFDAQVFSANIELTTDLRVSGTAYQPQVDGRIGVQSGELSFPSAKLPVSGAVDFVPRPDRPINPVLDINAEGDVRGTGPDGRQRDYHVIMSLSGPIDEMGIDLSAPDLPDRTDVLALLITGNADVAAIAQSRPGQPTPLSPTLAFAGSQLAAPMANFFQDQLARQLNLEIQLRTEVTSEGFRVVASKEINRRIRIEGGLGRSFAENSAVASTSATLHMTDRLFLEGSAQTLNAFGSSVAPLNQGPAGRLELKLRVFGQD